MSPVYARFREPLLFGGRMTVEMNRIGVGLIVIVQKLYSSSSHHSWTLLARVTTSYDPIRSDPNAKVYARKQQGASDLCITTEEEAPNLQSTRPCRSLPWLFPLLPLRPVTPAKVHPVPAIDVGEEVQYPIVETGEEVVEEMGSKAMASMRVVCTVIP
uniref:Uncharacterized protein n=1 Tax=Oryza nivara TaxID=4536 RepID=A0A0E0GQM1_ORYNI